MPQRTNAFQRLVTLLTATLAGYATVTESAMLQDSITREQREVDILVVVTVATYNINLGIEVISWGRRADTPWVEKMRAKHDNLPVDKLILVSESGFSGPAKVKAQFYGIETLTVDAACEADWPLIAALEKTGVFEVTTMNFDISAVCQLDNGQLELLHLPATASYPTPTGPITMNAFVRAILDRDDFREVIRTNLTGNHEHDFWFSYTEANGLWRFDIDEKLGQIIELRVALKVLKTETPIEFAGGKFRSIPFIAGTSAGAVATLQFVLVKNADGGSSGYLIDHSGVRTLTSGPKPPN